MSSDSDFDEISGDFDFFNSKFMKRLQSEIDEIFKEIKSEKLKGTWEIREIHEPGVKGYVFQGRFGENETLEPLDPLRRPKRRPMPEEPFGLPKNVEKEKSEPLTDIFEEKDATKVYVELPGVEKEYIQLKVADDSIEIKAKNFYKKIELPNKHKTNETVSSQYRNGVLEITIPKKITLRREDVEHQRQV